jgi:hypothetical protein
MNLATQLNFINFIASTPGSRNPKSKSKLKPVSIKLKEQFIAETRCSYNHYNDTDIRGTENFHEVLPRKSVLQWRSRRRLTT